MATPSPTWDEELRFLERQEVSEEAGAAIIWERGGGGALVSAATRGGETLGPLESYSLR
ncbi:Hypothetical predicted protein [Podarcis lilfordi]|uniref:Uncharacterized protein n=1 Tax=Podarcis lilfordi TaxID=74358 RepID=A0AA35K112_9SAUR|nr:Hypothetical predicted protein [Podarcis lilfordi]